METIVFLIFGLLLYFVPTFVAYALDTKRRQGIMILNLFLGWSGLFWAICLILAIFREKDKK